MSDTLKVKKANVVLTVSKDQKDYYLGQGYDVIGKDGKVLEETTALSVEALNRKVIELQNVVAQKDAEIAKLKKSMAKPKKDE